MLVRAGMTFNSVLDAGNNGVERGWGELAQLVAGSLDVEVDGLVDIQRGSEPAQMPAQLDEGVNLVVELWPGPPAQHDRPLFAKSIIESTR
jgi:hypothetical protein